MFICYSCVPMIFTLCLFTQYHHLVHVHYSCILLYFPKSGLFVRVVLFIPPPVHNYCVFCFISPYQGLLEMCCGLGTMVGPAMGGLLYSVSVNTTNRIGSYYTLSTFKETIENGEFFLYRGHFFIEVSVGALVELT